MSKSSTSEEQHIQTALRQFIRSNYFTGIRDRDLDDNDSLVTRGVIDSTGILELVEFVEQHFHIQVQDQELVPENFDSIRRLISYIGRKKAYVG